MGAVRLLPRENRRGRFSVIPGLRSRTRDRVTRMAPYPENDPGSAAPSGMTLPPRFYSPQSANRRKPHTKGGTFCERTNNEHFR